MILKLYKIFFLLFLATNLYSHSKSFLSIRRTISSEIKVSDSLKEEFIYAKGFHSTINQPPTTFFFPTDYSYKSSFDEKGISYIPNHKLAFLYDNQKFSGNIDLISSTKQDFNFYSIRTFRETQKYGLSFYDRRDDMTFQFLLRQYQMVKNYNGNSYLNHVNIFYGEDSFSGIVPGFIADWRVSRNFYFRYQIEKLNLLNGKKEFIEKNSFLSQTGYHRGDAKIFGSIEKFVLIFRLGKNFQLFFAPYSREHLKERASMYPYFTVNISDENAISKSFIYSQKFNQKINGAYFYLQVIF